MKKIKNILIIAVLTLIFPVKVDAYQADITKQEVDLRPIVNHFDGQSEINKTDSNQHYYEFVFDGHNLQIFANERVLWVDGEVRPYKTIEREEVVLPIRHEMSGLYKKMMVPAEMLVREFGYTIQDGKLVYDRPLGSQTEENKKEENKKNTDTDNNEKEKDKNLEENTEKDKEDNSNSGNSGNVQSKENKKEEEEKLVEEKEEEDAKEEAPPKDSDKNKEEEGNEKDKEDKEPEKEEKPEEELEASSMKVLGEIYPIGKFFERKASYKSKQKYIDKGNILTTWSHIQSNNSRATLMIGNAPGIFGPLQNKLSINDKIKVSDIVGKEKTYTITTKELVDFPEVQGFHEELYDKYRLVDSIIIQFQENGKMSFFIAQ